MIAGLALGGCAAAAPIDSPATAQPTPPPAPASVPPTPKVSVPVAPATAAPAAVPDEPTRLTLASADIDMPVTDVGVVDDGDFMELPEDPAVAGWYRYGSAPGATEGNVVISAHVDSPAYPIGPLSRLRDVRPGTVVGVADEAGGSHTYVVESVTYYPKAELPVEQLFARSGAPMLVLITCGGEFDASTGRYKDNVVALATPAEEATG